ncbi:sigma-70 family RNA polymerase sigma factor [Micromonosporaceae bacterium Da 78-11]
MPDRKPAGQTPDRQTPDRQTPGEQTLAERFEVRRPRLRAVAHRMLGSTAEAEDAVQEAWLRLSGAGADHVDNLDAWLTTVVGRVCLDLLRSRTTRREEPLDEMTSTAAVSPEKQAVRADSVGFALFVVLDTLTPAERLAFVLHDLFAVPFDEIATIVGRSPDAARQLASRARRRVRAHPPAPGADLPARRQLIDAFLTASRGGDFAALLTLLDPDVETRVNGAPGRSGAQAAARFFTGRAQTARPALIDDVLGIAVVTEGQIRVLLELTVTDGRIRAIHALTDPAQIRTREVVTVD